MKTNISSGVDEISNKLLKSIETELSKPLTIIVNQCLLTTNWNISSFVKNCKVESSIQAWRCMSYF